MFKGCVGLRTGGGGGGCHAYLHGCAYVTPRICGATPRSKKQPGGGLLAAVYMSVRRLPNTGLIREPMLEPVERRARIEPPFGLWILSPALLHLPHSSHILSPPLTPRVRASA